MYRKTYHKKIFQSSCKILENNPVCPGYYLIKAQSKDIAKFAVSGQFASIKVSDSLDPLIRRPLSFFQVDKKKGTFSILYQIRGRGTKILSEKRANEFLDIIGPLGNGFFVPGHFQKVALVAGGIGAAPLVWPSEEFHNQNREIYFLLGLKQRTLYNFLKNQLSFLKPLNFLTAIEEELPGCNKTVIDILENFLKNKKIDCIVACGPKPMLKELKKISNERRIPAYVSLEEHMACSIGVCKGCAVPYNEKDKIKYKLACKDGPVFQLKDIII